MKVLAVILDDSVYTVSHLVLVYMDGAEKTRNQNALQRTRGSLHPDLQIKAQSMCR